ncbi:MULTISPECIES: cell division protein ZapA [unclassified Luteibacter]|uniref:cell division protein ZapA n=1 Tax=unclassified Luteibacter TaxID=2620188 RepID=UPI0008D62166|nr:MULTISPECIES: cell division protein ZapA [unclassified Luteibacter]MDR6937164.1 cell division protein ZapA [Luteibacter sp. 3190]SEO44552.1 cell division protein ZapA [Luteibacter sp. UNC138MFCol5.1]SEW13299.1 cell division protein ZapA [Luteibacter sp. 329MFSha]
MNATASEPVSLRLLDREFHIACAPEERPGLVAAAQFLDGKMRELKSNAKVPGFDRIAVLAAVSIAHELLTLRKEHDSQEQVLTDGLASLRRKLDGLLDASVK